MRGVVEEKWLLLIGRVPDEMSSKFAIGRLQLQEVSWLLYDDLVVHQRNRHHATVTVTKTLHIRREAGQVVTGTLWRKRGREREREREREGERGKERERERETLRQTETKRENAKHFLIISYNL